MDKRNCYEVCREHWILRFLAWHADEDDAMMSMFLHLRQRAASATVVSLNLNPSFSFTKQS